MKYYHGTGHKKSYFEGWYFKHQYGENTIAFIPGISVSQNGKKTAFIQVITNASSFQIDYPFSAFRVRKDRLGIRIGDNVFSEKGISISIQSPEICVKGRIQYGPFSPIAYDIMGPFCAIPFMECNHGVISMHHTLSGSLQVNHQVFCFQNGTGYIETDWGSSFPKNYLWTQCSAPDPTCSVMASIANIPFAGCHFQGCIAVACHQDREYRFATYTGVRVVQCRENGFVLKQGRRCLKVDVLKQCPQTLSAPHCGGMSRQIHESAACQARYRLFEDDRPLFDFVSSHASFEYVPVQK